VSSLALSTWSGGRASRLDQLVAARRAVTGGSRPAQAVNWSLVLVLASEFQGFSRELHDEAADFLASALARGNQAHFEIIRNSLLANRAIDRGNARAEVLSEDFNRLGIDIWSGVTASAASGRRWKEQLDRLNRARNAIAHNNLGKLQILKKEGYAINSATVDSWRVACNGVGRHMDLVLKKHLTTVTGVSPW
jgi:hypothetical protein